MNTKNLLTLITSALLTVGTLSSADAGYLVDTEGRVVTNQYGECVHTLSNLGEHPGPYPIGCGGVMDSDGDGVLDDADACPGTPEGTTVDARGCPRDSDGDGVHDDADQCPGTAEGVRVDAKGCEIITLNGVNFETNKATLTETAKRILGANLAKITRNADRLKRVHVVGHTDSRGAAAYNQKLSQRRAQAVVDYLKANGVPADKLMAKGMGEMEPVADNTTSDGRARNRRVEISFE